MISVEIHMLCVIFPPVQMILVRFRTSVISRVRFFKIEPAKKQTQINLTIEFEF